MENIDRKAYRYRFTGHEHVFHNVSAVKALPSVLPTDLSYCDKTLDTVE